MNKKIHKAASTKEADIKVKKSKQSAAPAKKGKTAPTRRGKEAPASKGKIAPAKASAKNEKKGKTSINLTPRLPRVRDIVD